MISLETLLTRADQQILYEMLGQATVRLLRALDPQSMTAEGMRSALLALHSPHALLEEGKSRRAIIDLLREDEAEELCSLLGVSSHASHDPWEALHGSSRLGTKHAAIIFGFFQLPVTILQESEGIPTVSRAQCDYPLFEHQRTALNEVRQGLRTPSKRVLLHMPTGSGKTRTAMALICEVLREVPSGVVVWLANSQELCAQAADEFERAWGHLGNRETTVWRFWEGRWLGHECLSDGIVIASFATMWGKLRADPPWSAFVGSKAVLLVMDEAHQAIAATYQFILEAFLARHVPLLGLTATPGRTWNDPAQDALLADFFSRQKVSLRVEGHASPVDYLISEGYLAHPEFRAIPYASGLLSERDLQAYSEAMEVPSAVLSALADDEVRTLTIANHIVDLSKRHRRILLFATTVKHAMQLALVLSAKGIAARGVTAESSGPQRRGAISWYRSRSDDVRVLTNYGVLTTGFDAPTTSAALIARPTKSLVLYSQMVGRAIRGPRAGGNKLAEIVTVVDTELPGFGDMAEAFNNWEDVW